MDVVILPNFTRPEFLTLCLEQIQTNPNWAQFKYLFVLDYGYRRQLWEVIRPFKGNYDVLEIPKTNLTTAKQSYALIQGYRRALQYNPEFIFMIEDDIMVSNDFFNWHYKVLQANEGLFASIASRSVNTDTPIIAELEKYFIAHTYQSLGICFPVNRLRYFLTFFTPEYFNNPVKYVLHHFPQSKIGAMFCEQDGVFHRIVEKEQLPIAFPWYPRCYHAGVYGKGRGKRMPGTLNEKVAHLRNVIFNPGAMKNYLKDQPKAYYLDSIPTELNLPVTNDVTQDQTIMDMPFDSP